MQQDEAWSETEAAPRPLPVRNVLQDDVAAAHVSVKYNKSNFSYHTDRLHFLYLDFLVPLFFPFFKIIFDFFKGPYFKDFPPCLISFSVCTVSSLSADDSLFSIRAETYSLGCVCRDAAAVPLRL